MINPKEKENLKKFKNKLIFKIVGCTSYFIYIKSKL